MRSSRFVVLWMMCTVSDPKVGVATRSRRARDGSYPLLYEKGIVGSILKALVGYYGNPKWLRVAAYLGY